MEHISIFILGVIVSFFSSFLSGGLGILSLTGLLALGLSPYVALGTHRVGSIGFSLGGLYQYIRANKVIWDLLLPFIVIGIVGSAIGVKLILSIEESVIERMIGFAILLFIPFTLWKPTLGIERKVVSVQSRMIGHFVYFLIAIWGASVTIGTGILVSYSQMYFYGLTLLEVKGTARIPSLVKSVVAIAMFAYSGFVNWEVGIVFALGMFVGGFFGAKYAIKLGDTWLRYILILTVAVFSLKLILGL